jgi:hypothetical protein
MADTPVAKFIIPNWWDIVDSVIGLTLSPQSGTMNLATVFHYGLKDLVCNPTLQMITQNSCPQTFVGGKTLLHSAS